MQYLVDGYNLLFRLSKSHLALQEKRIHLISTLNDAIEQASFDVTLVFDGADDSIPYPMRRHFDAISLYYTTRGLTADDFILHTIKAAQHPQHYTVVTNDRDLAISCKVHGAKTLSLESFLAFLIKKKAKRIRPIERSFKESEREIARLLEIFEKRSHDDLELF